MTIQFLSLQECVKIFHGFLTHYFMDIKYYGHACFSIKEQGMTLVTDPYSEAIGMKLPPLKADVVTISHKDEAYNSKDSVEGEPKILNWPGEYEIGGVHFRGVHSFHNRKDDEEQLENIIFTGFFNGIRICHLGSQGTSLTPEQLDQIGDIDILFIPVGGKEVVEPAKAKEIIEKIEPRIIIPMVYHTEGNKRDLGSLESFLSVMGGNVEPIETLTVKKSELPDDNSKVVVLNVSKV